ncbi:MAG: hypothetical protein Q8858_15745 [Bacteroidota bacterium]|nr:hypothetical protein [Bacteroidota bacterium]
MKKQILTLMVSAAVFAMNPAFGMDKDAKEEKPKRPTRQIPSKADDEKNLETIRSGQVFMARLFTVHHGYGDLSWEDVKEDLEIEQARSSKEALLASIYPIPYAASMLLDSTPRYLTSIPTLGHSYLTSNPALGRRWWEELTQENADWQPALNSTSRGEEDSSPTSDSANAKENDPWPLWVDPDDID